MDEEKRKRLEAKGFKIGTVAEFLGLSPEEEAIVEIHAALARLLRELRLDQASPQATTAEQRGKEPSLDSLVESSGPGTSTDKLLVALLKAGATPQRIGEAIAGVTITQEINQAIDTSAKAESAIEFAATG